MEQRDLDVETGERIPKPTLNRETGEIEYPRHTTSEPRRNHFRIPNPNRKKTPKTSHNNCSSSMLTAALLFLLPTTVFFNPALSVVLLCSELCLHLWSHKKNKHVKDKEMLYFSPLHIICKEFCRMCIEENNKQQISSLQGKRRNQFETYRLECVKGIVS